jgi:hypothetical protein
MYQALTACKSKAEWIAGAQRYHVNGYGSVIVGKTPVDVWNWFCGSSNAPACTNT